MIWCHMSPADESRLDHLNVYLRLVIEPVSHCVLQVDYRPFKTVSARVTRTNKKPWRFIWKNARGEIFDIFSPKTYFSLKEIEDVIYGEDFSLWIETETVWPLITVNLAYNNPSLFAANRIASR